MRVEKISDDDIVLSLEPPPRSPDEIRQQTCEALRILGITHSEALRLEAYTAGHETLVFVHCCCHGCWYFPSLADALDAASTQHTPTLTLLRSTAGEWYIDCPEDTGLWEYGEYCTVPSELSHRLTLEPARLRAGKEYLP